MSSFQYLPVVRPYSDPEIATLVTFSLPSSLWLDGYVCVRLHPSDREKRCLEPATRRQGTGMSPVSGAGLATVRPSRGKLTGWHLGRSRAWVLRAGATSQVTVTDCIQFVHLMSRCSSVCLLFGDTLLSSLVGTAPWGLLPF